MSKGGRLEAKVNIATSHAVSATNAGGGPTTVTFAAGAYYPTDLLAYMATTLNSTRASGWTVAGAFGESGTGKVSIACTGTWSLTWTSTALRDLLGFTANLTGVTGTQAGSNAMHGVWLPDCPISAPDVDVTGDYQTDARQTIGPTGLVYTLVGNGYQKLKGWGWSHVSRARARAATASPMTWRQWCYETQLGGHALFLPGSRIALYSDADASTLLGYYQAVGLTATDIEKVDASWSGLWKVSLPDLILQAAG